ncbi:hypothetical protein Taro_006831 [Colocasia esculenta]|uniref:E3 ubiquitin-protein ligase RMA n=1 Tax=Colocasia esculenta TaxID=4460 RepID=A0A843TYI0_COLES|nr:hypothetical protein [Colocasia esculenta]
MDTIFIEDDFRVEEPTSTKETQNKAEADDAQAVAPNGCFDCNICLDYAAEPVVTLCGHLYCWPCIYQWLRQESSTPQRCPVCKAALSQATLVPLYGRGYDSKPVDDALDVPRRPSVTMTTASVSDPDTQTRAAAQHAHRHLHHRQHAYHHGHDANYTMSSSSMTTAQVLHPTMLGGVAIAVLPWVLGERGMGLYYPTSYPVGGAGDSPRLRRQEMQAKRSLHRISIFLLCCLVLCLLVF